MIHSSWKPQGKLVNRSWFQRKRKIPNFGWRSSSLESLRGGGHDSVMTRRYSQINHQSSDKDPSRPGEDDARCTPSSRTFQVSYLTDVEGDRDYLTRYVNNSRILRFVPIDPTKSDFPFDFPYEHWIDFVNVEENDTRGQSTVIPMLVYGGDVWDKGGSDLYVIRQLLALRIRYPSRVHLIMGNRDVNKMRMVEELGSTVGAAKAPIPHPGVYWKFRSSINGGKPSSPDNDDPVERLQWMLRETMGSPDAFEYRRQELAELRLAKQDAQQSSSYGEQVSDMDVVDSYRASCHPLTGEMGLYLSHAQLALRLGPALFIHGALPLTVPLMEEFQQDRNRNGSFWDDLTKVMPFLEPGVTAASVGVTNTMEWIRHLNDSFAKCAIEEWQTTHSSSSSSPKPESIWSNQGGYHNPQHSHESWTKLMQYGMGWTPDGVRNPTVVYNSWSESGFPNRFASHGEEEPEKRRENDLYVRLIREFLVKTPGLRVICTGHQPQGDMANVICVELESSEDIDSDHNDETTADADLDWIVSADTSYSGDVKHFVPNDKNEEETVSLGREGSKSGRGMRAVCEVLLSWSTTLRKELDTHVDGPEMSLDHRDNEDSGQASGPVVIARHGRLSDGTDYECWPLPGTAHENTEFGVGKVFAPPDNKTGSQGVPASDALWWTRAAFQDGTLMLCRGYDYNFWNCRVMERSVCEEYSSSVETGSTASAAAR